MKLKLFFTALFAGALLQAYSQPAATPDKLETAKGTVTIQPILHGTVVLTWNGKTIYVDPYGGAEAFAGVAKPDLILITDIHGDHLDPKTLDALDTESAQMLVPQAVADQLPEKYKSKANVIANGETTTLMDMEIEAIPMYNLPESEDSKHVKGRGNGYILNMGGKRIYLSGDTEDIPEMRALKNIDVAFVSMNLPYTMDIDQAASGVLAFKPKVVYPYHYRGQDGLANVEAFKQKVNAKNKNIEVRLRSWYPKQ